MKVCLVHNAYGKLSGEEVAVAGLCDCLTRHGHAVVPFFRSSAELAGHRLKTAGAFFTGIYNPVARQHFARLLDAERPDLVHINNLFPLISPAILDETRHRGIPTVMTLHNFRLICPTGLLMSHGKPCQNCVGGREWWCAIRNCTGMRVKSVGYALRSAVARVRNSFLDSIDRFIAPSIFVREILSQHGYPRDRIDVVRYLVDVNRADYSALAGEYVGYVGRVSPEKGIETIVAAAGSSPRIPFRVAGHCQQMPEVAARTSSNCEFVGEIPQSDVPGFLARARFVVCASTWHENSPLSLIEAMACGKPVIYSRVGALTELVEDGVTGLSFAPGSPEELSRKVQFLWERPELCRAMGVAARASVRSKFDADTNYSLLLGAYRAAMVFQVGATGLCRPGLRRLSVP